MVERTIATKDYARFMARVLDADACWRWNGDVNRDGYGKFWIRDSYISAHRLAYELFVGSIPDGLEIDHLCDNPWCVNPRHLKAATREENWERSASVTAVHARKTHCKNGHVFDEANTRVRTGPNGRPQRICRACDRNKAARRRLRKKGGA